MKLVGEIFLGTNDVCITSESVIDVFRISSKSSDSSDSSMSSESSKASAYVGRLSEYFVCL